jgi:hypothetical protein
MSVIQDRRCVTLNAGYELVEYTTGKVVLRDRVTKATYEPWDVIEPYPSHGPATVCAAVLRAIKHIHPSNEAAVLAARFISRNT